MTKFVKGLKPGLAGSGLVLGDAVISASHRDIVECGVAKTETRLHTLADSGFQGYLAHEFVPQGNPLPALEQAVRICTV